VDVAKESADIILLEKSLMVLEDGIIEGRKVFCNIVKYIKMGASSNFGNMFSVVGGAYFLPFLPMAPIQVLVNNLLYDFRKSGSRSTTWTRNILPNPAGGILPASATSCCSLARSVQSSITRRFS